MTASFDSSINDEVPMIKPLFESTLRKFDISFGLVIVCKDNNPHITDDFKVIKPRAHLLRPATVTFHGPIRLCVLLQMAIVVLLV